MRAIGRQREFRNLPLVGRQEPVGDRLERQRQHGEVDALRLDPAERQLAHVQVVADGEGQPKVGHGSILQGVVAGSCRPSAKHCHAVRRAFHLLHCRRLLDCRCRAGQEMQRDGNVETAAHLRLRALRPHAGAPHRRGAGRGRRPQLPGRRQSAQHLRPHGRRAGVRRRGILQLRIRLALRRRPVPVRRHPGVRLARVPAQLHLRQQEAHQVAEGPRRQAHRRAGLHHDGGDLHPRAAERRARHRLLQERMGRGRHQQRQAARQSDHPADRQEAFDQRQQVRQVAQQDAGGRRTAGHHRHRRAGGVRPQSRYRAALSGLPRGRDGILQAHQDFPDHAHGGDPPRRAREAPVPGDRAVSRLRPVQEHRAEEDELPRHAALHAAVDDRRARRDRRGVRRRSLALWRRGRTGRP